MSAPTVISLFSGAGGLDYGLEAAGFETRVCIDNDPEAVATLSENRDWPIIAESIFDVPADRILSEAALDVGDADLVVGGPPCQPFSKAGYWARGDSLRLEDPRAFTLVAFMRVVAAALPRVVLFENVRGFAYRGKSEAREFMDREFRRINAMHETAYVPVAETIQAADYGVPQLRERFLLVAARDGARLMFPTTTHSGARQGGPGDQLSQHRTAWDAIGDLGNQRTSDLEMRGKWADLLPSIPEGHNYLFHTDRGGGTPLFGWRRRYWSFLLKLAKDRPSWTIPAQPGPAVGPFHWENRRLSVREMARIQTFPDDVDVIGGLSSAQRQIGNAVPSLLAETIGRALREQLLDRVRLEGEPALAVRAGEPVPPPGPTRPVPHHYRGLAGHDSAHPGTGMGRGALRRATQSARLSRNAATSRTGAVAP